jgi:hypothetical protein
VAPWELKKQPHFYTVQANQFKTVEDAFEEWKIQKRFGAKG